MNLREQLRHLESSQSPSNADKCRLFYDGSIRTRTVTLGSGEGWLLLAAKIPGAGPMFGHFFGGNEERYLKTRDLRQAIELRDQMFRDASQDQTIRTMRKQIRKEMHDKARKASKSVRRVNVMAVNREKNERKENEKPEPELVEVRTPSTVMF